MGNGRNTFFWHDSWLQGTPLKNTLAHLHLLAVNPLISIAEFLAMEDWSRNFRSPLSFTATDDYRKFYGYLSNIRLLEEEDS